MSDSMIGRSPEAHFLDLCAREPEATSREGLLAAARSVRDWQKVAELAIRHRVAGYVLQAAAAAGIEVPAQAAEQLRVEFFTSQAVVLLLEAELQRAMSCLLAANVPVLVLKGPALARTIYPDRALRPYSDLDLAVQAVDEERAAAALVAHGFDELAYATGAAQRTLGDHLHDAGTFHRMFAGANGRALIELHQDQLQLGVAPVLEVERWARAVPLPGVAGAVMLAPEDQVVQLSVHAHKHGFNRLIWIKDLDLLLRARGDVLDWKLIEQVSRREGVTASVWYTLQLARTVLGTPLPAASSGLRPAQVVRWLYALVWPQTRIANLAGFVRRRSVQFQIADSWRLLPSLLLMGRRSTRARMLVSVLLHR